MAAFSSPMFSPEFENLLASLIVKKLQEFLPHYYPEPKKPKEPDIKEGYFTKKQAHTYLGISLSGLNNHLKDKKIKSKRIGTRVLIKKSDLEKALI